MSFINTHISYSSSKPLNGAFKYIQDKTGVEDIVSKQNIKVSVSSTGSTNWKMPVIRKDLDNVYFETQSVQNSWYEVDLLDNYFNIERYVLRINRDDFFKGGIRLSDFFPIPPLYFKGSWFIVY